MIAKPNLHLSTLALSFLFCAAAAPAFAAPVETLDSTCCDEGETITWTAPVSGFAVIQLADWKDGWRTFEREKVPNFLSISEAAAPSAPLAQMPDLPVHYAAFLARAGTTYEITLDWRQSLPRTRKNFRLVLSDSPFIQFHPATMTISPGASAYFFCLAPGYTAFSLQFQWQFNGADIPGQTTSMLAFHEATPEHAGEYRARVSATLPDGTTAVSYSDPARLFVPLVAAPARLHLLPGTMACTPGSKASPAALTALMLPLTSLLGRAVSFMRGMELDPTAMLTGKASATGCP